MNILRRSLKTFAFYQTMAATSLAILFLNRFPVDALSVAIIAILDSFIIGRSLFKRSRSLDRKWGWVTGERICSIFGWVWLIIAALFRHLDPVILLWLVGIHAAVFNIFDGYGKSLGDRLRVMLR